MALSFVSGRDVVIVLDEENISRIQDADPFELDMAKMGTYTMEFPFRIHICYARSDDQRFKELIEQRDMPELLKYLSRGFKITGRDFDGNYTHVRTMKAGKQ